MSVTPETGTLTSGAGRAVLQVALRVAASIAAALVLAACRPQDPPAPTAALADGEARVVVRVLSADGQPVADAYVGVLAMELLGPVRESATGPDFFVPRGGERLAVNLMDVKKTRTDSDGAAEVILKEPLLEFVVYAASGVNVATTEVRQARRSETARVELSLEEGLVAVGTVTDDSGTPGSNVELEFSWAGSDPFDATQVARRASGSSDPDGRFRLGPILPLAADGEVEIVAHARGPVRAVVPAWRGESRPLVVAVPSFRR